MNINGKYSALRSEIDLYNWTGNQLESIKTENSVNSNNKGLHKKSLSQVFNTDGEAPLEKRHIAVGKHAPSNSVNFLKHSTSNEQDEKVHTGKKIIKQSLSSTSNYEYKPAIKTGYENNINNISNFPKSVNTNNKKVQNTSHNTDKNRSGNYNQNQNQSHNIQNNASKSGNIVNIKRNFITSKANKTSSDNPFYS